MIIRTYHDGEWRPVVARVHDGTEWSSPQRPDPGPPPEPEPSLRQVTGRSRMGTTTRSLPAEGVTERVWIPTYQTVEQPVVLFGNQSGTTTITYAASIESPNGILPLSWNGQSRVEVGPGGYATSDPAPTILEEGGFYLRIYGAADGPVLVPDRDGLSSSARAEGRSVGDHTSGGDLGAVAANMPLMPLGAMSASYTGPSVCVLGDSIGAGSNDNYWGVKATGGFTDRGLSAAGVPWRNCSRGGEHFIHALEASPYDQGRYADLDGITHALIQLGANAMGRPDRYRELVRLARWAGSMGPEVWVTTVTPQAHSTDGWTTLEGQEWHYSGQGQNISQHVIDWNTWLRDGAPMLGEQPHTDGTNVAGLTRSGDPGHWLTGGVVDTALAVESSLNSGLWRVDAGEPVAGGDYIHPSSRGHELLAEVVESWAQTLA